ncbi:MAG: cbb3-type cytochrome c oxidase subunit I, partial [Sphingomicrobium sp.]
RMVNWHFWLATLGIVLYASALWVAGITQGLMTREYGADGYLVYAFAEIVAAMKPYYMIRVVGGLLYLIGGFVMAYNVWMTIRGRVRVEAPMSSAAFDPAKDRPIIASAAPQEAHA